MVMRNLSGVINFYDFRKTLGLEVICGSHVRHNFSRHTHRNLCIGVVEQGIRTILCRGENYEVGSEQVFIIPPDVAHCCESKGEPHTYRLFIITPDVFNMILPKTEEDSYRFKSVVINDRMKFEQLLNLYTVLTSTETSFVKQSVLISTIGDVVEDCADIGKPLRCAGSIPVSRTIL